MTPLPLPDDATLAAVLGSLLARDGVATLVARRPNACFSSSPTEIVTLALPDGTRRELFVKYGRPARDPEPRCRQDVAYCGLVYERIVHRLPMRMIRCLGVAAIGDRPDAALVLEHLGDALRVNEAPDDSGVLAAAEWCGRLHAWGKAVVGDPRLAFLTRYEAEYYRAWSQRAVRLAAAAGGRVPAWLERVCADFDDRVAMLAAAERTVIHGEFGPQNVLWKDGGVYPVDWESAAVGPGAIDLATLLFAWPADTVRRGIEAYWHPQGTPPPDFEATFAAATLYTAFRWLPEPTAADDPGWLAGLVRIEWAARAAPSRRAEPHVSLAPTPPR